MKWMIIFVLMFWKILIHEKIYSYLLVDLWIFVTVIVHIMAMRTTFGIIFVVMFGARTCKRFLAHMRIKLFPRKFNLTVLRVLIHVRVVAVDYQIEIRGTTRSWDQLFHCKLYITIVCYFCGGCVELLRF